jgi:hypothetical protein
MAQNRTNHNTEEEFDDTPLSSISKPQLDQLTKLLWMDPGVNVVMPDQKWLQSQYLETFVIRVGEPEPHAQTCKRWKTNSLPLRVPS